MALCFLRVGVPLKFNKKGPNEPILDPSKNSADHTFQ
jgi:hypothetical protein